jgi:CCR4-NOT transcription complex subunit 4
VLDPDDEQFFPCPCGYQVCRFCWHRIRTDPENPVCPQCRTPYSDQPDKFTPLDPEAVEKLKKARRGQKDHSTLRGAKGAFSAPRAAASAAAANAKTVSPSTNSSATAATSSRKANAKELAESRTHLQALRVLQRNLVFVIGLSGRLTDPDVLKSKDYLGRFGKIIKAVVSKTTPSYAGSQPSASAYVTFARFEDAYRALLLTNNTHADGRESGRVLRCSLGTTKYCTQYLKGVQCTKSVCVHSSYSHLSLALKFWLS